MKNNKTNRIKRILKQNKFNRNPEKDKFISNFQEILRKDLIIEKEIRDQKKINPGISLSCQIQPEIYLKTQDLLKKITGQYQPMDEFIEFLFHYFVYIYGQNILEAKKILPFKRKYPGRSFENLKKFQDVFKKYYNNDVLCWER